MGDHFHDPKLSFQREAEQSLEEDIEEKRERRSLRHWVIRMVVISVVIATLMLVAAVAYNYATSGQLNTSILSQLFKTLMDIINALK